MKLQDALVEVGREVVRLVAVPWLREQFGRDWEAVEERALAATAPIFAELARAAAGEGLLGGLLASRVPDGDVARRLWEIERPYFARATVVLAELGIAPSAQAGTTREGNAE